MNKDKKTELGVLKINNAVIASIARSAALQVSGVKGIKKNLFAVLADVFGQGYQHNGISLDIAEHEVKIGITIIVQFGVSIPEIANLVQENIRSSIEDMTGLTVSEVNVNIGDIQSADSEN